MRDYEIIEAEAIRRANEFIKGRAGYIARVHIPGLSTEELTDRLEHEIKKVYEFLLNQKLLGSGSRYEMARERGESMNHVMGFNVLFSVSDEEFVKIWNLMRPVRLIEYTRIVREWKGNSSALELANKLCEIEVTGPFSSKLEGISRLTRVIGMWASGELMLYGLNGYIPIVEYTPEVEGARNIIGHILERECFNVMYHGKEMCPDCERSDWYR